MKKLIILLALLLVACGPKQDKTETSENKSENIEIQADDRKSVPIESAKAVKAENNDYKDIDLKVKPNELGKIMVLMYHGIGKEDEWVRSPENFRKDLETLYEKGYYPLRLEDYVKGNITTPAGKTPVIITFDDTNDNNFAYLADGTIDPKCAVGVLLDFAKAHEDIKPHAIFFGNGEIPFRVEGEEEKKVKFLIENDMDIGNHTVNHPDLTGMSFDQVTYEVGHQAKYLQSLVPEGYKINTIALPFGSRPENPEAEKAIFSGKYEGSDYENIAVLNVGWNPDLSPYHKEFTHKSINRIRASEMNVEGVGIHDWIGYFDQNPGERFISDGKADIITIPNYMADFLNEKQDKKVLIY